MATKTGRDRVWNYEDNNVPLFQVEVCEFREIILLYVISSLDISDCNVSFNCTVIPWVIWIIAPGLKKRDQHQFISSKSCDLLVTMML